MLVAFLLPVVLQARTTRTNSDSARPKDLIVGTLSEIVSSSCELLDRLCLKVTSSSCRKRFRSCWFV